MPVGDRCLLTVNGGSSSVKFAVFEAGAGLGRVVAGSIQGVGLARATFQAAGARDGDTFRREIVVPDHVTAVGVLAQWLETRLRPGDLVAIGHRVVHGGPRYSAPQRITPALVEELHRLSPFDPEHLPEEILLTEIFHRRYPALPQVACFDTAFHHDLPRVAQLFAIPRRYYSRGVRRYGFHGLSYSYLMEELARVAGAAAARGRVVLAHLGNGASLAAVRDGKPMDTTMGLTPASGVPMSTRAGDLDPGLVWYLSRTEAVDAKQFNAMINFESGLLGVSETTSDMRELLQRAATDERAADAVGLFCYQLKKWIGALAAVLGGIDTLVFSGGIGERSPDVRARACEGLAFLGLTLDARRNADGAAVISAPESRVTVRVMHTDEELVIAHTVCRVLGIAAGEPAAPGVGGA
jgi:acetate kinase